jgi:hypothetical protein
MKPAPGPEIDLGDDAGLIALAWRNRRRLPRRCVQS